MKIVLTGSSGQLGKSLLDCAPANIEIIAPLRDDFNLLNPKGCKEYLLFHQPNWVINCAAYTAVDAAEKFQREAFLINSESPKAISKAIKEYGGKLLHLSTDFVFDGKNQSPYRPFQKRNPINIYGKSKSEGEIEIENNLKSSKQALILRTSWLMGPTGDNFALKMLQLHKKASTITVVNDQFGSPTTTISLAKVIWKLIHKYEKEGENIDFPFILHWSDLGIATWYDIAVAVGEIAFELKMIDKPARVIPISTKDYPTDAERPKYSCIDSNLTQKLIGINGTNWRANLEKLLTKLSNKKNYEI